MGYFIDKIHLRQPLRAFEPLELCVEDLGPILDCLFYLSGVGLHGWFLIACQGISAVPRRRVLTSLLAVLVLVGRRAHQGVSDETALAI